MRHTSSYAGDDDRVIFVASLKFPVIFSKIDDVERACDHIHVAGNSVQSEAVWLIRNKSQIADADFTAVHSLLYTTMLYP